MQLDDYTKVECPKCRRVESDDRIKVFGLIPIRIFIGMLIGLCLLAALAKSGVLPVRIFIGMLIGFFCLLATLARFRGDH